MKNPKTLRLLVVLAALVVLMFIGAARNDSPQNFNRSQEAQSVQYVSKDLCGGVTYFDDTVTRQIIAQYVDGRSWQNNGLYLMRDDNYRAHGGEFALGAAGRDPRDGCPYELISFKGTSFMFAIKRDSSSLDGHYVVEQIELYKAPVKETPGFVFDDKALIFFYEAEDGSEIEESIPYDIFPIG